MDIADKINDIHFSTCPIRNIIARIGDRWSILVLLTLESNERRKQPTASSEGDNLSMPTGSPMRFKEIEKAIPDISQKMLTHTLRNLEADGMVTRHVYAEVPPRVEYRLTARARTLTPLLNDLVVWATAHLSDIINDRERYNK